MTDTLTRLYGVPGRTASAVRRLGMNLVGSTPEQLQALIDKEIPRWADVVKRANIAQ